MTIDVQTHLWSSLDQLGPQLSARMASTPAGSAAQAQVELGFEQAAACVDASLVLGFRSELLGARIPNELVAEFVARQPRRRIGVCGVDPMCDDAMDQVDAGHELGLAAVTVSPPCQGFHPSHSSAMRVYERCAALSMPLIVTSMGPLTASAVLEFGRPSLWDEVARSLPRLPIVIGQLGQPWIDETLLLLSKHENLCADISGVVSRPWQLYNALLSATSMGVMDKLLFGSGFPFDTPAKAIEALYSVNGYSHGTQLPSVPRSLLRGIVERDSLSLLGIESELAARHRGGEPEEPVANVAVSRHLRPLSRQSARHH